MKLEMINHLYLLSKLRVVGFISALLQRMAFRNQEWPGRTAESGERVRPSNRKDAERWKPPDAGNPAPPDRVILDTSPTAAKRYLQYH